MRDAGDLAVVGHDDHRGARKVGLLVQQLEDLHAGAEVELAGRLVGQQDRVAGGERARDRHALLLAARQLVREMVEPAARGRRARASRSHRARGLAAGDVRAELDVLDAVSAGNRLKVWKMKLTLWRGSGTARPARRG